VSAGERPPEARAQEALARRRDELALDLTTEDARREDLTVRIANNRAILAEADTLRGSARRVLEIDARVADLRAWTTQKDAEAQAARADAQTAKNLAATARARSERALERARSARVRLATEGAVREAQEALPDSHREVRACEDEARRVEHSIHELHTRTLHFAESRALSLRKGLSEIAGGASRPANVACHTLNADDEAVAEMREAPARAEAESARLTAARRLLEEKRGQVATLERLAARAGEMQAARQEAAQAEDEADRASAEGAAEEGRARAARLRAAALGQEIARVDRELRTLGEERASLASLAARAQRLASADARL
jgi:hypothetical protein